MWNDVGVHFTNMLDQINHCYMLLLRLILSIAPYYALYVYNLKLMLKKKTRNGNFAGRLFFQIQFFFLFQLIFHSMDTKML